jgi:hypothetical protein
VFYDPEHREAGGITATDRRGNPCFYPFLSLSIGAVPLAPALFHSHKEVAVVATEVKSQAKKMPGNSLFVDRRQRGEQAGRPARTPVPSRSV